MLPRAYSVVSCLTAYMLPFQGVSNIASVCLAIGYPTIASVPHSIVNGFKNLLAIAVETDINFKEADMVRLYLSLFLVTHTYRVLQIRSYFGVPSEH